MCFASDLSVPFQNTTLQWLAQVGLGHEGSCTWIRVAPDCCDGVTGPAGSPGLLFAQRTGNSAQG